MAGATKSLDVLRRREFRLLFAGQTVSGLGDRMVAVALAFAAEDWRLSRRRRARPRGEVFPSAVTALVGGVVADRTSRRAAMVGADLPRVASQRTMAVLLISGSAQI